jgi:hypothetical protein
MYVELKRGVVQLTVPCLHHDSRKERNQEPNGREREREREREPERWQLRAGLRLESDFLKVGATGFNVSI